MSLRAAFACDPARSRGRLYAEAPSATRTAFQRDRDRIVHATAFRRLKHKTQVFVAAYDDHFRTRLTHSLEVAQIARTLARQLGLDEDLTETLALAHDLGHPAFGHAGETALNVCMAAHDGFDHNAQTIRVLTFLEQRYAAFDGLNLSWETLEGLAKHNGPVQDPPWALRFYQSGHNLELQSFPSLEAQIAALADDIAYNTHDLDDGLRSGLFALDDALRVPIVAEAWAEALARFPAAPHTRLVPEMVRILVGRLTGDMLAATQAMLREAEPTCPEDIRSAGRPLVGFSTALAAEIRALKDFLRTALYRHPQVLALTGPGQQIITDLFALYLDDPERLPPEWACQAETAAHGLPRLVADFVAGMTDRFAIRRHQALTGRALLVV